MGSNAFRGIGGCLRKRILFADLQEGSTLSGCYLKELWFDAELQDIITLLKKRMLELCKKTLAGRYQSLNKKLKILLQEA